MPADFLNPPMFNAPVAIYQDGGGLVSEYAKKAFQYRMEGREVQILGSCRSACLMALSVPKVCVGPDAEVKAHHAYDKDTGMIRDDVTAQMLVQLPYNIASEIGPHIRRDYTPGATLNADKLVELGIRRCGAKKPATVVARDAKAGRPKTADPLTKFLDATIGKLGGK